MDRAFDDLAQEPDNIHFLCLIGLRSWPKLPWQAQDYWKGYAGKLKGVDCRQDLMRCMPITMLAFGNIILKREPSLKVELSDLEAWVVEENKGKPNILEVDPQASKKASPNRAKFLMNKSFISRDCILSQAASRRLAKSLRENPISPAEMEAAVAHAAVEKHKEGHLLFSVAPDLSLEEATVFLEREYSQHLQRNPAIKQRAGFHKNWLPLIAEFENDETSSNKVKCQVFARYRRAVDGIQFA